MISHRIVAELVPVNTNPKTTISKIKQMEEIKAELAITKSQLDKEYEGKNMREFDKYWKQCDPFKEEKAIVAKLGNTSNVSNAWLKCYEILVHYDLIPQKLVNSEFTHFDNAAFPGSFIISTHHLVATSRDWFESYKWYGSSLISTNELDASPLEDKYELYKNYPDKWLMSAENNGDVLSIKNQMDFRKRLGGKVDLYTSDLGFDVSSDYNNQEILQCPANIGQIISGLLTLRKGGSFITKQFTTFESITISVMYAVAYFFDEFYICKPYTSREANSETFLVGKGFKGEISIDHPYIVALFDKVKLFDESGANNEDDKVKIEIPIIDIGKLPMTYLKSLIKINKDIYNRQINKLNDDISRVYSAQRESRKINFKGHPSQNPIIKEYIESINATMEEWYLKMNILPLLKYKKLNMKDIFYQSKFSFKY